MGTSAVTAPKSCTILALRGPARARCSVGSAYDRTTNQQMTPKSLGPQRVLGPLRLPFRHGPDEADSTGDTTILEIIRAKDWRRLGGLLGAVEPDLAQIVTSWNGIPANIRDAVLLLVKTSQRTGE